MRKWGIAGILVFCAGSVYAQGLHEIPVLEAALDADEEFEEVVLEINENEKVIAKLDVAGARGVREIESRELELLFDPAHGDNDFGEVFYECEDEDAANDVHCGHVSNRGVILKSDAKRGCRFDVRGVKEPRKLIVTLQVTGCPKPQDPPFER